jgi:hypothetical protein
VTDALLVQELSAQMKTMFSMIKNEKLAQAGDGVDSNVPATEQTDSEAAEQVCSVQFKFSCPLLTFQLHISAWFCLTS